MRELEAIKLMKNMEKRREPLFLRISKYDCVAIYYVNFNNYLYVYDGSRVLFNYRRTLKLIMKYL